MASRTVQLPEPVFAELNAIKIRAAVELKRIPTNGDIIAFALGKANEDYKGLIAFLSRTDENATN